MMSLATSELASELVTSGLAHHLLFTSVPSSRQQVKVSGAVDSWRWPRQKNVFNKKLKVQAQVQRGAGGRCVIDERQARNRKRRMTNDECRMTNDEWRMTTHHTSWDAYRSIFATVYRMYCIYWKEYTVSCIVPGTHNTGRKLATANSQSKAPTVHTKTPPSNQEIEWISYRTGKPLLPSCSKDRPMVEVCTRYCITGMKNKSDLPPLPTLQKTSNSQDTFEWLKVLNNHYQQLLWKGKEEKWCALMILQVYCRYHMHDVQEIIHRETWIFQNHLPYSSLKITGKFLLSTGLHNKE